MSVKSASRQSGGPRDGATTKVAVYRSVEHATSVLLAFVPTCSAIASTGLDTSYETIRSWVLKFGPVSRDGYEGVVIGRLTDGIWARSWSGSPASGCASGVPSTTRVRSSTCWFSAGATPDARRRITGKTPLRQDDRRPCFIPVSPKATLSGNAMRRAALLLARNKISPSFTGRRTVALEQPQR